MALYLSDGRKKLVLLTATPADVDAITTTEATAGVDASGWTLTTSQVNQPSGSDSIDEKVWSSRGNAKAWGASNMDGNFLILHREYDAATMQPDTTLDATWAATYAKGSFVKALTRLSAKLSTEAMAADDEYRYAEYTTDDPIDESGDGYIKYRIPLAFAGVMSLDNVIVAGA